MVLYEMYEGSVDNSLFYHHHSNITPVHTDGKKTALKFCDKSNINLTKNSTSIGSKHLTQSWLLHTGSHEIITYN